jgi:hypothetical protein
MLAVPMVSAALPIVLAVERDLSLRPLKHEDYDVWSTISTTSISRDGKWVMYGVTPGEVEGEMTLRIRSTSSATEYVIVRGAQGQFSYDSRFAICRITPDKKQVKELQKAKTKPDEMPKAKLQILDLASGDQATISRVKSFAMPRENGDWIAYLMEKPVDSEQAVQKQSDVRETYEVTAEGLKRPPKKLKLKKRESLSTAEATPRNEPAKQNSAAGKEATAVSAKKEPKKEAESEDEEKKKPTGTRLVLRHLDTGVEQWTESHVPIRTHTKPYR